MNTKYHQTFTRHELSKKKFWKIFEGQSRIFSSLVFILFYPGLGSLAEILMLPWEFCSHEALILNLTRVTYWDLKQLSLMSICREFYACFRTKLNSSNGRELGLMSGQHLRISNQKLINDKSGIWNYFQNFMGFLNSFWNDKYFLNMAENKILSLVQKI